MRRKATITEREIKTLIALSSYAQDDDHPVRARVPVSAGWHIGRDLAAKLKVENKNVVKHFQPLIEKGLLQVAHPPYFDSRNRPADLKAFRLKRDINAWKTIIKHAPSTTQSPYTMEMLPEIEKLAHQQFPQGKSQLSKQKRELLQQSPQAQGIFYWLLSWCATIPYEGKRADNAPIPSLYLPSDGKPLIITLFDALEALKTQGGKHQKAR